MLQGQLQFKEGACDMPRDLHFLCGRRVRPVHLNLSLVITEKGGSENQEIKAEVLHGYKCYFGAAFAGTAHGQYSPLESN